MYRRRACHQPARLGVHLPGCSVGTMNVVGGYVVTDRMLEMFKSDKGKKKEEEAK